MGDVTVSLWGAPGCWQAAHCGELQHGAAKCISSPAVAACMRLPAQTGPPSLGLAKPSAPCHLNSQGSVRMADSQLDYHKVLHWHRRWRRTRALQFPLSLRPDGGVEVICATAGPIQTGRKDPAGIAFHNTIRLACLVRPELMCQGPLKAAPDGCGVCW